MQDRLIQRYLGNKSPMAAEIITVISELAKPGDLIFDAFAGTLSVSASLRAAGFRVAANDINHFSWTFGNAFFSTSELPWPDEFLVSQRLDKNAAWEELVTELIADFPKGFPKSAIRTDIFDHYCEEGSKSAFQSSRGLSGRRRFFSSYNAAVMDRALSRIRYWHQEKRMSEHTRCLLVAALLSGVEKISNTQGTYHDFPRELTDSRSLHPIKLRAPTEELFGPPASQFIGKAQDTLNYVKEVPPHKVLYLDPPYNFRQYTSYYFMLNLISEYAEIANLDDYFDNIEFVRGQNMASDFKSQFCGKKSFLPSLKKLIADAKAEFVVLSYFDGRNHWGEFKSDNLDVTGKGLIQALLQGELFEPQSASCIPVKRLNYQSYGGFEAKNINEFLFVAQKRIVATKADDSRGTTWNGNNIKTLVAL